MEHYYVANLSDRQIRALLLVEAVTAKIQIGRPINYLLLYVLIYYTCELLDNNTYQTHSVMGDNEDIT